MSGVYGKEGGSKVLNLNGTLRPAGPAGTIKPVPLGPATVPPPGPMAVVPSGATNWLRVIVVLLPAGSVSVITIRSLIVAGIWPETEPSLKTVRERTTPLV